jgi:hypothetical protein
VLVQMELEACKEKLTWEQKALELICEEVQVLIHNEAQVLVQME